jgi:hypothetical protein
LQSLSGVAAPGSPDKPANPLEKVPLRCHASPMEGIAEIRESAARLTTPERAELAVFLLSSLDDTHHRVDDDEVRRRARELESGEVRALTHEEFMRAAGR